MLAGCAVICNDAENENKKQKAKDMKTHYGMPAPELVAATLAHKNWTGLSLAELIEVGRVDTNDRATIRKFVVATIGEPQDIEELHCMFDIVRILCNN